MPTTSLERWRPPSRIVPRRGGGIRGRRGSKHVKAAAFLPAANLVSQLALGGTNFVLRGLRFSGKDESLKAILSLGLKKERTFSDRGTHAKGPKSPTTAAVKPTVKTLPKDVHKVIPSKRIQAAIKVLAMDPRLLRRVLKNAWKNGVPTYRKGVFVKKVTISDAKLGKVTFMVDDLSAAPKALSLKVVKNVVVISGAESQTKQKRAGKVVVANPSSPTTGRGRITFSRTPNEEKRDVVAGVGLRLWDGKNKCQVVVTPPIFIGTTACGGIGGKPPIGPPFDGSMWSHCRLILDDSNWNGRLGFVALGAVGDNAVITWGKEGIAADNDILPYTYAPRYVPAAEFNDHKFSVEEKAKFAQIHEWLTKSGDQFVQGLKDALNEITWLYSGPTQDILDLLKNNHFDIMYLRNLQRRLLKAYVDKLPLIYFAENQNDLAVSSFFEEAATSGRLVYIAQSITGFYVEVLSPQGAKTYQEFSIEDFPASDGETYKEIVKLDDPLDEDDLLAKYPDLEVFSGEETRRAEMVHFDLIMRGINRRICQLRSNSQ